MRDLLFKPRPMKVPLDAYNSPGWYNSSYSSNSTIPSIRETTLMLKHIEELKNYKDNNGSSNAKNEEGESISSEYSEYSQKESNLIQPERERSESSSLPEPTFISSQRINLTRKRLEELKETSSACTTPEKTEKTETEEENQLEESVVDQTSLNKDTDSLIEDKEIEVNDSSNAAVEDTLPVTLSYTTTLEAPSLPERPFTSDQRINPIMQRLEELKETNIPSSSEKTEREVENHQEESVVDQTSQESVVDQTSQESVVDQTSQESIADQTSETSPNNDTISSTIDNESIDNETSNLAIENEPDGKDNKKMSKEYIDFLVYLVRNSASIRSQVESLIVIERLIGQLAPRDNSSQILIS